jgi:hypothetical protein
MTPIATSWRFIITALSDGGYTISGASDHQFCTEHPVFACTTIEEALKYIKQHLMLRP